MRSAIVAVLLSLTILAVLGGTLVTEQAVAQQSGGKGKDKNKGPPAPPPPARCPDLALATYAFITAVPGDATPLAANEVALQWNINNAGTMAYSASTPDTQSLVLEYLSPSGAHEVASMKVPTGTAATPTEDGITLAQGGSWRGVMRATLPPEAQRRRLRLVLNYVTDGYHAANDCDLGNNEMDLVR